MASNLRGSEVEAPFPFNLNGRRLLDSSSMASSRGRGPLAFPWECEKLQVEKCFSAVSPSPPFPFLVLFFVLVHFLFRIYSSNSPSFESQSVCWLFRTSVVRVLQSHPDWHAVLLCPANGGTSQGSRALAARGRFWIIEKGFGFCQIVLTQRHNFQSRHSSFPVVSCPCLRRCFVRLRHRPWTLKVTELLGSAPKATPK